MSKTFRAWDVDQVWLLPASVHDFVPAGHPAHLRREPVRAELGLTAILAAYDEERCQPPYHPAMMVALLLDAYTQGVYASRRIAKAYEERLDVMAVTGMQQPDFRTIATSGSAIWWRSRRCSRRFCACAARPNWSSLAMSLWTAPSSRPTPASPKR